MAGTLAVLAGIMNRDALELTVYVLAGGLAALLTITRAERLNAGPCTLAAWSPGRDRYGRLLRPVPRHGESLGAELVREGLAEAWQGRRGSWC